MHLPPPPDARDLLPPLLACLPTSSLSPRPPPALLPLLAPVLRQRINFLSSSGASGNDGWLPLLSWDPRRAAKLPAAVERIQLEPHPVSGEIELEDVRPAKYRRLDDETLHARLEVEQFDLLPVYLWVENDEHGGTGPGWKLAELRSLEDREDGEVWSDGISQANDIHDTTTISVPQLTGTNGHSNGAADQEGEEEDDTNDDYWASYDRTPGRTPAPKHSPAPPPTASSLQARSLQQSQAEQDYYARYGSEVQPALDNHDPDEDTPEVGESTLQGNSLLNNDLHLRLPNSDPPPPLYPGNSGTNQPHDSALATALEQSHSDLSMPRPISPTSPTSQSSVDKLEEQAAAMSMSTVSNDRALLGIKQHISTDIKSLFRLAKTVGMDRSEFERIVKTELECLKLLEADE
jgi:hypothetical protein